MTDSTEKEAATTSFEVSVRELERLVAELEKSESSLEQQLKSFEKGVALSRKCLKELDAVERRVELLISGKDGKLETEPFPESCD